MHSSQYQEITEVTQLSELTVQFLFAKTKNINAFFSLILKILNLRYFLINKFRNKDYVLFLISGFPPSIAAPDICSVSD